MNAKKNALALICLTCCFAFTSASLYAGHRKHKHRDKPASEKRSPGEKLDHAIDRSQEKIEVAYDKIAELRESVKDAISEHIDSVQSSVKETVDDALSD